MRQTTPAGTRAGGHDTTNTREQTMNEISWADTLVFGSDEKSRGYYDDGGSGGVFTIRFRHAADGRCISMRHRGEFGEEFVGAFKTVGAAKRRARQIVTARKAVRQ